MKLYKYRSCSEHAFEGLKKNQLFFSKYSKFNDPFEFSTPITDLSKYNERARVKIKQLHHKGVFNEAVTEHLLHAVREPDEGMISNRNDVSERINKVKENISIHSLSQISDNILMWSHYANDHKGFCVEYSSLIENVNAEFNFHYVNYTDTYYDVNNPKYLIDFYIKMFSERKDINSNKWELEYKKSGEIIKRKEDRALGNAVMCDKHQGWSYENEVRLISSDIDGVVNYNPITINSIILGMRISDENRSNIIKICKMPEKQHIKLMQALPKKDEFGLKLVPIE